MYSFVSPQSEFMYLFINPQSIFKSKKQVYFLLCCKHKYVLTNYHTD